MQQSTRITTLIFVSFMVTACVVPYVAPPVAGNATVSVEQQGVVNFMRVFQNGRDCSETVLVPNREQVLAGLEPLLVASGKEFALNFLTVTYSSGDSRYCALTVSFVPAANARYRLRFSRDSQECVARLVRVESRDGSEYEATEPTFRKRVRRTPLFESGSFCQVE